MTDKATPKVSVCIPVYQMAKWLPQAIESVQAQTVQDFEILVFDDGSTDGTREVALGLADQDKRIVVTHSDFNEGGGVAFSKMIPKAKGEYILPFAADDVLSPTYIERALQELELYPAAMMVACHPAFIDAEGNDYVNPADSRMHIPMPVNLPRDQFLAKLKMGNLYFGVGMYRKQCFDVVGMYDNNLQWLSDWDYYIRILKMADIRIIEEKLCKYRLHDNALSLISQDKLVRQAQYVRTIRRRHYSPTKRKIIIATPFYMGLCFAPYKSSITATTNWFTKQGIEWDVIDLNGDSYVDRAKNTLAAKFLESDGTDLFMIDSDMSWDLNGVARMLSHNEDVVAGAFPMKNAWNVFTGDPELKDGLLMGKDLGDGSSLLKARMVAGGFILIKRNALERFADAYPDNIYLDPAADPTCPGRIYTAFFECCRFNFQRFGEDAHFCRLCRDAGIGLWMDPNITFGHFGFNGWHGNWHDKLKSAAKAMEDKVKALPAPQIETKEATGG